MSDAPNNKAASTIVLEGCSHGRLHQTRSAFACGLFFGFTLGCSGAVLLVLWLALLSLLKSIMLLQPDATSWYVPNQVRDLTDFTPSWWWYVAMFTFMFFRDKWSLRRHYDQIAPNMKVAMLKWDDLAEIFGFALGG